METNTKGIEMLVLARYKGQKIIIGDRLIEITVVDIAKQDEKSQVRLGIQAPLEMPVHREEIYLKIQADLTKPGE